MLVRQEDTGEEIPLDGDPLGRGGEAAIYAVPRRPQLFAKVYHKPSGERAEKLAAMLAAPPDDPMAKTGHPSIAWPTARLLAAGANLVVGYLMPRVEHGRLAIEFYNPRMRQQLCPLFHYRYLVRTAQNLAVAVRAIHERGYVIGDLNESNVLVTNQALVALVDTDSFQVHTPARLFRCRVGKPEYTPPELQNARFTDIDRLPEHDAFGLAVLIFQFLMQGTHPFAGMHVGEGEAGTIPRRIAAGHWPYAQNVEMPIRPSPHAPPWEVLPPSVQVLMRRCFEDGHAKPSARPGAIEWQRALQEAEQELKICPVNGQHHFHRGLATCPWCALAQQQGRDPFPSLQEVRAKGKSTLKVAGNGTTGELPVPLSPTGEANGPASAADMPAVVPDALGKNALPARVHARIQFVVARMQTWPRSRLIATGAAAAAALVLILAPLVFLAPKVWSLIMGAPTPVVIEPPPPPPPPEEPIKALKVFTGHTGKVTAVRFLPGGKQAVSCSVDKTLRLWNLTDGGPIRSFDGHQSWVTGFAFTGDGRTLLSASADKTLRLWDVDSGKEQRKLQGPCWMNAVALSADGKRALSGGDDNIVRLWDVDTPQLDFAFTGHTGDVTCVALTPDGKIGLSGGADGHLLLWDVQKRQFLKRLIGHTNTLTAVAFTAEGRWAVSAARDRTIRLWDIDRGSELLHLDIPDPDLTDFAVSSDARRLVTVANDGMLRFWDLVIGQELARAKAVNAGLRCVSLSPDGSQALTGSEDGAIRLWSLPALYPESPPSAPAPPTLEATSKVELRNAPAERFFFLPENRLLALERERGLSLRDVNTGAELRAASDADAQIVPCAVSGNGRRLIMPGPRGALQITDISTGVEIRRLAHPGFPVKQIALSAEANQVFYPDRDHSIVIWAPGPTASVRRLKGHSAEIVGLAATPDGNQALSASHDGTARLWDVVDGRVLQRFVGVFSSRAVTMSPDGRYAAILSRAPVAYLLIWDLHDSRPVRYLPVAPLSPVYLGEKFVLTVDRENGARIWDIRRGEEIARLAGNHLIGAATFVGNAVLTVDETPAVRKFLLPEKRGEKVENLPPS